MSSISPNHDIISLDMITIEEKKKERYARFYIIQYVFYDLNRAIIYKIEYEKYTFFVLYVREWEKYAFMATFNRITNLTYYYNQSLDKNVLQKHSKIRWMTIDDLTNYLRSLHL